MTGFLAAFALVVANVSTINDKLVTPVVAWVTVPFVTDTTLVRMIGALDSKPESRDATLRTLDRVLDRKHKLVPLGRAELVSYVQGHTRWNSADARCTTSPRTQPGVEKALAIALTPRLGARRWMVFGRREILPASRLSLDSTNLRGVRHDSPDLRKFSLIGACLDSAVLNGALLDSAVFQEAQLRHAKLELARGRGVVLSQARLEGANLNGAVLPEAKFRGARLACVTAAGATLDSASFWGARVEWAFFHATKLNGVEDWTRLDSMRLTRAFVRTAVLDSAAKAWAYRRGADSVLDDLDWTEAASEQRSANGECDRLAQEP